MTNKEDFKDVLGEKYSKMFKKNLAHDINDIKKELEDYLYELDDIWSELGRQDHDNFDFDKILEIKPELAFIGDPSFNGAKSIEQMDLDVIVPVIEDYLNWDVSDSEHLTHLDLYLKNKSFPSAEELIEFDLSYKDIKGHTSPPVLTRLCVMGKANMYLISYFIHLRDTNQLSKLALS